MPIDISAKDILPTIRKHKLDKRYNLDKDDMNAIANGTANEELSTKLTRILIIEREHFSLKIRRELMKYIKAGWKNEPDFDPTNPEELKRALKRGRQLGTLTPEDVAGFALNDESDPKLKTKLEKILKEGRYTNRNNRGRA